MDFDFSRRRVLLSLSAMFAASGCTTLPRGFCPNDPRLSNPASPLTIDVHAHVFNGSDLQIKEFLLQTATKGESEFFQLVRVLGSDLLQALAWHAAPSALDEEHALDAYAQRGIDCLGPDGLIGAAGPAFQHGYSRGREQLRGAARSLARSPEAAIVLGPDERGPGLGAAIDGLPETFAEFARRRSDRASVLGSQPHLLGYLDFVLHHFNYRHINALDYLNTYSAKSSRKVDLLVACLVDYDWWLARGNPTATRLEAQVDLMGRIAVLMGGRVHGFAPFCPFREAMTQGQNGIGESLRLVMRATQTQGFIGVKLYPPMGFAPWGNASLDVWNGKTSLDRAAWEPGFGRRLDAAMERLFVWCIENDVPIMTHANRSNGPNEEFRALAGAEYWKAALERFPGLRVSFGHSGDTDFEDHDGRRSTAFVDLMASTSEPANNRVFADSAYFGGVLSNPVGVAEVLGQLYTNSEGGILKERLMYGTDWTMILPLQRVESYLAEFAAVLKRVESSSSGVVPVRGTSLSNAFFGENAAEFLGLKRGQKVRRRLEQFYVRHGMSEPGWMRKIG